MVYSKYNVYLQYIKHITMKAKQIHLDEKVIKALTFLAVKDNTTFKELAQKILELAAIESGYYEQSNSN